MFSKNDIIFYVAAGNVDLPPNNYCPHSSLDYLTPSKFARRYYEKIRVTEVKQQVEKAGSLSL